MHLVFILLLHTASLADDESSRDSIDSNPTISPSWNLDDLHYFASQGTDEGCENDPLHTIEWDSACAEACFKNIQCHVFAKRQNQCELYQYCDRSSRNIDGGEIWLLERSSIWGSFQDIPSTHPITPPPSYFPTWTSPSAFPTVSPTRGIKNCMDSPNWDNNDDHTCDDLAPSPHVCHPDKLGKYGISKAEACCNCYGGGYFLLNASDPEFADIATDIDFSGPWSMAMWIQVPLSNHARGPPFHHHLIEVNQLHLWIERGCLWIQVEKTWASSELIEEEIYTVHIEYDSRDQNDIIVRMWANNVQRNVSEGVMHYHDHESDSENDYDQEPIAVLKGGIYFANYVSDGFEVQPFHEFYMPSPDDSTRYMHLLIGPGIVFASYIAVVIGTTLASMMYKTDKPFYFKILTIFLGFYDVAANLQLVILLVYRNSYYQKLGLVFTLAPFFISQMYLIRWYRQEASKNTVLGRHLVTKQRFVLPVMLLASAQMNILALAWSRILPITLFHMPISSEQRNEVMQGRAINIFFQDAPMLLLQYIILHNSDNDDSSETIAAKISLFGTVCALVISLHYVCSTSFQRFENSTFKSQWITLENPKFNPLMLQSSIKKRFHEHHKSEIVEVQVIRKSCDSYKVLFRFTGNDELHLKSEIRDSLLICTDSDSTIIFEDPPIIQEILQQVTAMCNTFLTNEGRILVDPVGREVTIALKNVDGERVDAVEILDDLELEHAISTVTKFHDKLTRTSHEIRTNLEANTSSNPELPEGDVPLRLRPHSDEFLTMTESLSKNGLLDGVRVWSETEQAEAPKRRPELYMCSPNDNAPQCQMSPRSIAATRSRYKSLSENISRDQENSVMSNDKMSPPAMGRQDTARRSTSNIGDVLSFTDSRRNLITSPSNASWLSYTDEESGGVKIELSNSQFGSNKELTSFPFPFHQQSSEGEEEENSDSSSQHSQFFIFTPSNGPRV